MVTALACMVIAEVVVLEIVAAEMLAAVVVEALQKNDYDEAGPMMLLLKHLAYYNTHIRLQC